MTSDATLLLALLFVAHFLGDFTPLSTPGMLRAKAGKGSVAPILGHAAVHGILVGAAVAVVRPSIGPALTAMGIELATHFGIDFAKMRLGVLRPAFLDPGASSFWHLLGADQLSHTLILVAIAAYVL